MHIVLDMNLSPGWVAFLGDNGHSVTLWGDVGVPSAPDVEIALWAAAHGAVVMTQDLDFGHLLAMTNRRSPSVILIRTGDASLPTDIGSQVVNALTRFRQALEDGAIVVVDMERNRLRMLPFELR